MFDSLEGVCDRSDGLESIRRDLSLSVGVKVFPACCNEIYAPHSRPLLLATFSFAEARNY